MSAINFVKFAVIITSNISSVPFSLYSTSISVIHYIYTILFAVIPVWIFCLFCFAFVCFSFLFLSLFILLFSYPQDQRFFSLQCKPIISIFDLLQCFISSALFSFFSLRISISLLTLFAPACCPLCGSALLAYYL